MVSLEEHFIIFSLENELLPAATDTINVNNVLNSTAVFDNAENKLF